MPNLIPNVAVGSTITVSSEVAANTALAYNNSGTTVMPLSSLSSTTTTHSTHWSTATFTQTITFASGDAARYFFNAGGQIRLSFAKSGGTSPYATANANFAALCTAAGTINIGWHNTTKTAGSGTTNILLNSNNGGYWAGTASPVSHFKQFDTASGYTTNFIRVNYHWSGTSANGGYPVLNLTTFFDGGTYIYDGTTSVTASVFSPATTYVNNTWGTPTCAGSVAVTVNDTTAPTAPTTVTASSPTVNSMTVSWSGATDNIAVTQYQVYYSTDSYATVRATTTGATSVSVTGLSSNTAYTFKVKAGDASNYWSVLSVASTPVTTLAAPVNTVLPTISDTTPTENQLITCSTGTWTGNPTPTYTYQWQYGTTNISGATSSSYTVASAYIGQTLRCVVTGTNIAGTAAATTTSTSAVASGTPTVTSIQIRQGSTSGSSANFSMDEGTSVSLYAMNIWSNSSATSIPASSITSWSASGSYITINSTGQVNPNTLNASAVFSDQSGQTVTVNSGGFTDTISVTVINYVPPPNDPVVWVNTSISGVYYETGGGYAVNQGAVVTLTAYASGTNMSKTVNWTGPDMGNTTSTSGVYTGYVANQLMSTWTFTPTYTGGISSGHYSAIITGTGAQSPAYGTVNINVRVPFPTNAYTADTRYVYGEEFSYGNWAIGSTVMSFQTGVYNTYYGVTVTLGSNTAPSGFHWSYNSGLVMLIKDSNTAIPVGVNHYSITLNITVYSNNDTYIPGSFTQVNNITIDSAANMHIYPSTSVNLTATSPNSFVFQTDGWLIRSVTNASQPWLTAASKIAYSPDISANGNALNDQANPSVTVTRQTGFVPASYIYRARIEDGVHYVVMSGLLVNSSNLTVTYS